MSTSGYGSRHCRVRKCARIPGEVSCSSAMNLPRRATATGEPCSNGAHVPGRARGLGGGVARPVTRDARTLFLRSTSEETIIGFK
eukprot:7057588-Prymnesium_polylepis.1